jgi:DnaJ like chaperone protein
LAAEATFEQVRNAYREKVKQYHPDRVAHLGAELRRVAETKTFEYNTAYKVLQRLYAGL